MNEQGLVFLITTLAGLIGACATIYGYLKKGIDKLFEVQLQKIEKRLDAVDEHIADVDINATKNYLVQVLSDVEQGAPFDEIEKERFYEQYQHYQNVGGNSYIKRKVETLQNEGKL